MLALLELRTHALSGDWDVVVVDCAPTAETLRLLALPEALGWYMGRVFGVQRRVVRALRPVLARAAGVPMPEDSVFDAVERLHARPGGGAADPHREGRQRPAGAHPGGGRGRRGPPVADHAVAVRLPRRRRDRQPGVPRGRRRRVASSGGSRRSRRCSPRCEQSFADLPIWRSAYQPGEPVGPDALAGFAEAAYAGDDPFADADRRGADDDHRTDAGAVLRIALPFAQKHDVDLARHGDELVVTVGSYRRLLALPAALRATRVVARGSRTARCRCGSGSSRRTQSGAT